MKSEKSLNDWIDQQLERDPDLKSRVKKRLNELKLEEELIRLRKEKGLSQSQFAKILGVSQPFVAKLESGRVKRLNVETLVRAAEAAGYKFSIRFEPNGNHINGASNGAATKLKKVAL